MAESADTACVVCPPKSRSRRLREPICRSTSEKTWSKTDSDHSQRRRRRKVQNSKLKTQIEKESENRHHFSTHTAKRPRYLNPSSLFAAKAIRLGAGNRGGRTGGRQFKITNEKVQIGEKNKATG